MRLLARPFWLAAGALRSESASILEPRLVHVTRGEDAARWTSTYRTPRQRPLAIRAVAAAAWHRSYSASPDRPRNPKEPPNKAFDSAEQPSKAQSSAPDSHDGPPATGLSSLLDTLRTQYSQGLHSFNTFTGYNAIESLKSENSTLEKSIADARAATKAAQAAYKDATSRQAAAQRDMSMLLARKASWSAGDKAQLSELLESETKLERDLMESQRSLEQAEQTEQNLISRWLSGVSRQYYEQQGYSDRVRQVSTWWTWWLMGFNLVLFVLIQFVAEPWKRGRLLNSMIQKERELLEPLEVRDRRYQETVDSVEGMLKGVVARLDGFERRLDVVSDAMGLADVGNADAARAQLTSSWTEARFWTESFWSLCQRFRAEVGPMDLVYISLQGVVIWFVYGLGQ